LTPIRLAILGSGIFARDAHLPSIKALGDTFEIVAIYSRNSATAQALAATLPGEVQIYTELAPLLARTDIDAVDIIMPIAQQPDVITASLKAGKHVISEKPVAPDVTIGRKLIEKANELTGKSGKVWTVAENWRYETAFRTAGDVIRRGEIGQPIQFNWATSAMVNPQNKYYHTGWRRDNSFPGGFLLDGGVHNIAAMRLVMGEIDSVSAFVNQIRPDLPPTDTLSATFRFDSGAFGTWTMTFVAESPWETPLHVLCDKGALRASSEKLDVFKDGHIDSQTFDVNNVQAELADFARVIQGAPLINTPEQALQDVAIIHAILESARTGCSVQPERIV
jgi:predicted dehydrogenase